MLIYTAHHRPGPHADDVLGYRAVCNVGPDGSRPPGFQHYDDQGGLPEVNSAYCELSVLRKIQTDRADRLVGLTHYRRIFTARRGTGFKDAEWGVRTMSSFDWAVPSAADADVPSLTEALSGATWCTADPLDITGRGFRNLRKQFELSHDPALLEEANGIAGALHPGAPTLYEYLESHRRIRPFNMFIGSYEALDRYASDLWSLLEAITPRTYDSPFQRRWPGFIAERYLSYWSDCIAPTHGIGVTSLPIVFLDGCTVSNSAEHQREVLGTSGRLRQLKRRAAVATGRREPDGSLPERARGGARPQPAVN